MVILKGATIGRDCNICAHCMIENNVVIGDRVTIKSGVQLWDGIRIEDDVFVGPNVTFTNDKFPRSKVYPEQFLESFVRRGASIGANATILPGLTIGANAMIGAGSVVSHSVPANAIVVGNPGRIVGYVDADKKADKHFFGDTRKSSQPSVAVTGVTGTVVVDSGKSRQELLFEKPDVGVSLSPIFW